MEVIVDSAWYIMNPLDIEFDSIEQLMIDSDLAELIRSREISCMAVTRSMDKVGPICRNALDCAIVFNAIRK